LVKGFVAQAPEKEGPLFSVGFFKFMVPNFKNAETFSASDTFYKKRFVLHIDAPVS
jgi:hypothetical protein